MKKTKISRILSVMVIAVLSALIITSCGTTETKKTEETTVEATTAAKDTPNETKEKKSSDTSKTSKESKAKKSETKSDTEVETAELPTNAVVYEESSAEKIYESGKVDIVSVKARKGSKNIQLIVALKNRSSKDRYIDCSKLAVKTFDIHSKEINYKVKAGKAIVPAGKKNIKYTYDVAGTKNMKKGDYVYVYYKGDAIDVIQIS